MATKSETIRKRLETIETQSKTLSEKLAALSEEYRKLSEELASAAQADENAAAIANGLPVGANVTFVYGRAESKRTLNGVVKASKPTDAGRQYKIESGEGFDTELFTVLGSAISAFTLPTSAVPGNAVEENR